MRLKEGLSFSLSLSVTLSPSLSLLPPLYLPLSLSLSLFLSLAVSLSLSSSTSLFLSPSLSPSTSPSLYLPLSQQLSSFPCFIFSGSRAWPCGFNHHAFFKEALNALSSFGGVLCSLSDLLSTPPPLSQGTPSLCNDT